MITPAQHSAYVAAEELGRLLSNLPNYLEYDTLKKQTFVRASIAFSDFIAKNTTNA